MLSEQDIEQLKNPEDIPFSDYSLCIQRAVDRTEWHAQIEFGELKTYITNLSFRIDAHTEGNILSALNGPLSVAVIAGIANGKTERFDRLTKLYNAYSGYGIASWEDIVKQTGQGANQTIGKAIEKYMGAYTIAVFFENLRREIHAYRQNEKLPALPPSTYMR